MTDPTTEFAVATHGDVVLEYHHRSDPRRVYLMTDRGFVLRRVDGEQPRGYYAVNPASLPEQVGSVRASDVFEITRDVWSGPVADVARPSFAAGDRRPEEATVDPPERPEEDVPEVAIPTVAGGGDPPSTEGEDVPDESKPMRMGARATRALEGELGLNKTDTAKAEKKAKELAAARVLPNGKNDTMVRVWDVYEAAGRELPPGLDAERTTFLETGKMTRSTGSGRGNAPGETADPPPPPAPDEQPAEETEEETPPSDDETL